LVLVDSKLNPVSRFGLIDRVPKYFDSRHRSNKYDQRRALLNVEERRLAMPIRLGIRCGGSLDAAGPRVRVT
jgi:hypothetical protein